MKLNSYNLMEGLCLLEDIEKEQISLKKGKKLTTDDIEKIKMMDIEEVSILVGDNYNTFNQEFDEIIDSTLNSNDFDKYLCLAKLMSNIVTEEEILQYDLSTYFSENYNHLVNTIKISMILAKKFNEVTEKNKQLNLLYVALAAILEDIGRKAKDESVLADLNKRYGSIIDELILKYPILTKYNFLSYNSKYHPIYSYLISLDYEIDEEVRLAILLHHEKEDGDNSLLNSPLSKLEECEYVNIARIIKLADLYDIIISTNVNNNPNNPFEGIGKQIDKMVASDFVNAKLTNILKNVIPIFQVGTKVILSDGTKGIIESNDANEYNNPKVVDLNGNPVDLDKENITVIRHSED